MEQLIPSFAVDHTGLRPGIYVSRRDECGGQPVTTYDIRMTAPGTEPAMAPAAVHTIEHVIATLLRNDPEWGPSIVYWGPMGCLTGMYLIIKGDPGEEQVRRLMTRAYTRLAEWQGPVPGAAPANCGNHLMHDLPMARWEARRYVERLTRDFHCRYPGAERPKVDGAVFYDA